MVKFLNCATSRGSNFDICGSDHSKSRGYRLKQQTYQKKAIAFGSISTLLPNKLHGDVHVVIRIWIWLKEALYLFWITQDPVVG